MLWKAIVQLHRGNRKCSFIKPKKLLRNFWNFREFIFKTGISLNVSRFKKSYLQHDDWSFRKQYNFLKDINIKNTASNAAYIEFLFVWECKCFKYIEGICTFLLQILPRFLQLKIVYRVNVWWFVWLPLIHVVACSVLTWQAVLFNLLFFQNQLPHPPQIFLFAATPAIIWHIEGICHQTSNVYCFGGIPSWREEKERGGGMGINSCFKFSGRTVLGWSDNLGHSMMG